MSYTRQNPSARYRALVDMYRDMHQRGERFLGLAPEATFTGRSLEKEAPRIKRLIDRTGALTLLDYGSGKGRQYDPKRFVVPGEGEWDGVIDYLGVDEVTCFDPGYPPYSKLPTTRFDGVVCTDVLEHCPEEDVDWIIDEIFSFAERFVYLAIACYPADKRLPSGENAHCTIRPPEWWRAVVDRATAERPGLIWEMAFEMDRPNAGKKVEVVLRSGDEPAVG